MDENGLFLRQDDNCSKLLSSLENTLKYFTSRWAWDAPKGRFSIRFTCREKGLFGARVIKPFSAFTLKTHQL